MPKLHLCVKVLFLTTILSLAFGSPIINADSNDLDGDGYTTDHPYCADCDDNNAAIHPGISEESDGIDNNCNGQVDEPAYASGIPTWYQDSDGDTYGDSRITTSNCEQPDGFAALASDCDDTLNTVYPGAPEIDDDNDNNCDGEVDELTTFYQDLDDDGFGNPNETTEDYPTPDGYVLDNTDCDDTAAAVNPDADETANFIDDNCDGATDEGFTTNTYYLDSDGDGFGDSESSEDAYEQPEGYVTNSTDCNDDNNAINPDADELCSTVGVDDDCDGEVDEDDATDLSTWYADSDGDGVGDPEDTIQACTAPVDYVASSSAEEEEEEEDDDDDDDQAASGCSLRI
ncbi:MAG: putative metal-binding motif-containing protein [bacterium]|nr:hypothetical protein [bacterium]MBU1919158.1 hypothetical protein [bacterium]